MNTLIVAASPDNRAEGLSGLADSADLVIAVDGGAAFALAHGVRPDVVMGDMDSLLAEDAGALQRDGVERLTFSRRKDETDLELALLEAVRRGATDITIVGALGGRLDHTLGNVYLLAMPRLKGRRVRLVDGSVEVCVIWQEAELRGLPGDSVSLFPLTPEVSLVETEGLEYPLRRESLFMGPGRGISNAMLGNTARISVGKGILLVVQTHRLADEEGSRGK